MKYLGFVFLSILLLAPAALAESVEVTLEGSFVWASDEGDRDGELEAVFTPNEEGAWDVSFYFFWDRKPHIFSGVAQGSLKDGTLEGIVRTDNPDRPGRFRFEGTFADGIFRGTHGILRDGKMSERGTLLLTSSSAY